MFRLPLKLAAMPLRLLLMALRTSRTPTLLVAPTLPLKVTVPDDSTARFPKPSTVLAKKMEAGTEPLVALSKVLPAKLTGLLK